MPKVAEIQRFVIWLCGSVMVFGFIATLIAYLLYDNQAPADCQESDCAPQNDTVVVTASDNRILKIVAPSLIAFGLVVIVCIRCWQQNTSRQTVAASEAATNDGEDNGGYEGPECKIITFFRQWFYQGSWLLSSSQLVHIGFANND